MSTKFNSTTANDVILRVRDRAGAMPATAQISLVASLASLVFLMALHILSPEFDPSSRMVSEYALGTYGWVLSLMFLAWALSCVALFFAITSHVGTIGGKIGLGFLLTSALGMAWRRSSMSITTFMVWRR